LTVQFVLGEPASPSGINANEAGSLLVCAFESSLLNPVEMQRIYFQW